MYSFVSASYFPDYLGHQTIVANSVNQELRSSETTGVQNYQLSN